MALKDVIESDNDSVFLNEDDFATKINYDGQEVTAVKDTDLKREYLSMENSALGTFPWDSRYFVKASDFQRLPKVTDYIFIDGEGPMTVTKVENDIGMLTIYVLENES